MNDALVVMGALVLLTPLMLLVAGVMQILVNGEVEVRDDGLLNVDPGIEEVDDAE